ncbi:gliding motility-associated C-terminal domain-containing protein [Pontibacter sp. Tf4]|uniref:T9SS type B sorting domain-containing protein n=1 Tax=Pontibacter sp. Tf4 TaxID=2761620 RepID=UPI001624960A|nr:gliding motility-associated C-terminal domain-containing protein [Pontibacter sp. Tf4]MBB6611939.1 gliding motility-associated C-terminal domain-containing protein [Pontibacter sp. Tf4]
MEKRLLLFLLLLCTCLAAQAQAQDCRCFKAYNSNNVEITTFCVGQEVFFRDCTGNAKPEEEYYDFDDSDGLQFTDYRIKSHVFTEARTYTVTQVANVANCGNTGYYTRTFEVKDISPPHFEITYCANNTVKIDIAESSFDSFLIDYDNEYEVEVFATGEQEPYTFTSAPDPNDRRAITVRGKLKGNPGCPAGTTIYLTPLSPYITPTISQVQVLRQDAATGEAKLTIEGLVQGYQYTLEQRIGGTFQPVRPVSVPSTSITIDKLNTSVPQQFRITGTDACNQNLPASNIITTIPIVADGGNERATVNWQTIAGTFQQFDVYRNGVLQQSFPGATTAYTDANVRCGQQYCYELRGRSADGKSVSVSAQPCVSVTSTTPPPAPDLLASFNLQNEIELSLRLPPGDAAQSITYDRSLNGTPYKNLATTPDLTLTDKLTTIAPVCYRATFTNACNLTSAPSTSACPVVLTVKQNPDETVLLTWTNYSGFSGGVTNYSLELLDESGNVISSKTVQGNRHTEQLANEQEQVFRYRIKATSATGEVTYSNNETIKLELVLFIPSGFTPNGDGLNDVFEVKGKRFERFALRVLNGAGQVVYTSADRAQGWDGTYNGKAQPAGSYAYEVTVTLQDGTTKRRTGTVTLLR